MAFSGYFDIFECIAGENKQGLLIPQDANYVRRCSSFAYVVQFLFKEQYEKNTKIPMVADAGGEIVFFKAFLAYEQQVQDNKTTFSIANNLALGADLFTLSLDSRSLYYTPTENIKANTIIPILICTRVGSAGKENLWDYVTLP